MPRRTQTFIKANWTGGVNTSVDSGVLPDNDLVLAENVVFAASGSRLKRQGIDQFDVLSNIPSVTHRASSGTTRTLTFAVNLQDASPAIQRLVVGERITVTGGPATYNGTFYVTAISTNTITYTGDSSLAEGSTADTAITVVRACPYIDVRDYWRLDSSYVKQQQLVAFTSQGKLFKFDSSGRRVEIRPKPEISTVTVTNADSGNSTNGDWFKIYDSAGSVGVYIKTSGGADTPPTGLADRVLKVDITTGDSAATIATAIKTAVDADSKYTATVLSTTVTITDTEVGARTDIADGTASGGSNPTGWTFAVVNQGKALDTPFTASPNITRASSITYNERYICCPNAKPIKYRPEDDTDYYYDLEGNPPKSNSASEFLGRLILNDIEARDRLHYSTTSEHEEWQGTGDSGYLDIGIGDGDPDGILAVSPVFKNRIFVGKGMRIYQVIEDSVLIMVAEAITQGLGCAGHRSFVPVDFDDLLFISQRGVHSIAATDSYGDFTSAYLTKKIQPTFNDWTPGALYKTAPVYIPNLNSVAFNVTGAAQSAPSEFWFYNVQQQEWYKWPDWSPTAACARVSSTSNRKLLFADNDGKLYQDQNGDYTDADGAGGTVGYRYKIRTGSIYVDGNPQTIKGYKNISFLFRAAGRYSFTVKVWVDNIEQQTRTIAQTIAGDALGTAFILGTSVLGASTAFAPYTVPIEGYGRSIRFEIENANQDEQVEIYGYIIEYEGADIAPEVL